MSFEVIRRCKHEFDVFGKDAFPLSDPSCPSSSSSCRAVSTDLPDPLSPSVSIVHYTPEVFKAISCIGTELLYIGSSCSSCLFPSLWRGPQLMSSSLLLQQCPLCLVRLTWIVFVMGGRWPYSCCFVGFSLQDLFNVARSIRNDLDFSKTVLLRLYK